MESVSGDGDTSRYCTLGEFSQGYGWESVMAVQEKCDEKNRVRSFRCADISAPTLRKVREGWGSPSVTCASEIKGLGHPPFGAFEVFTG